MGRIRLRTGLTAAFAACVVLAGLAPAAVAQDDEGPDTDDQIVITGRLIVPEGESVEHALIFNGPATIEGTVAQSLVVFNGRTEIIGTVAGDLVVFKGDVVLRSGSRVGGDVVSLEAPQVEDGATIGGDIEDLQGRWNYWDATFIGRLAWWLAFTVSSLVLGMGLLLLASAGLDAISIRAMRERLGGTIGFGLLVFLLLPVVAVLLLVTIVGIPLGIFLLLALALVYSVGYVIGALAIGRLLVKPPTSRYFAFLAGWGALRVLALIPFVGGLAWLVATVLGLGTLWVGARARRTGEVRPGIVPPMPAEG
jgi:hypothetical protein